MQHYILIFFSLQFLNAYEQIAQMHHVEEILPKTVVVHGMQHQKQLR